MRKLSTILFAVAIMLFTFTTAHAVTISVGGDTGDRPPASTGQLQIIVDIAPENFFFNDGGLSLAVTSSQPGVIEFTAAEVSEPPGLGGGFVDRWALRQVNGLTADGVEDFFAASANTPGLDPAVPDNADGGSASSFIFATIDYQVIGAGLTDIGVSISARPDPLVNQGVDVSSSVAFQGDFIRVIPEPATLMLAGMGLIGVVAGRRRG